MELKSEIAATSESGAGTSAGSSRSNSTRATGYDDIREAIFNGRECGPAFSIARPVDQVSAIHGFMIDLDCGILDPAVVGQECVESADILYERHVQGWLERDPVLAKAEARNTGHGLHILLWLDEPIICNGDEARHWDKIARGLRVVLPGDPNLNGITERVNDFETTAERI